LIMKAKSSLKKDGFQIIHPHAAGIDIASQMHYVAVPPDRDEQPVRKFGSFTTDLHEIAKWLRKCNINTVAMESTGIYWIQLYLILEEYGFEVFLVNARHVKNVSGRKSDILDCQWILQLHTYGLLNPSFQPENMARELRSYMRHRKNLTQSYSTQIQLMQKAFEQMNIKLHNVLTDITGKSGQQIIQSILSGERNAQKLSQLADKFVKATKEDIIKLEADNTKAVLNDIYKMLEKIAVEDNLTIVIDKNNVLYGRASQDLTDKLRDRMRGR